MSTKPYYNIEDYPTYAFEDYLANHFIPYIGDRSWFWVSHKMKRVEVHSFKKMDFFVLAAIKNFCTPYSVLVHDYSSSTEPFPDILF